MNRCRYRRERFISTVRYVYWQEGEKWLGYLKEYPDYWTQGGTWEELKENLRDIHRDLTGGKVPGVRRVAELQVS